MRIEQLGDYIKEVSKRNKELSDFEVFSVTNSEGFIRSTDYFSKEVFSKDVSNYKIVSKFQFAYNPSRINVGSVDYLEINKDVIISPLYVVFECNKELHPEYLKRFLKSPIGNVRIRAKTKGAVRDSLSFKGLSKIKIPILSIPDQLHIANLLSKAEDLINQRKESIRLLDEFLKSTFLEMFGNNTSNDKGWKQITLVESCLNKKDVKCGPFGTQLSKSEYQVKGIPVWGIPQINSEFKIHPKEYVTESKALELEQYSVVPYDIVMSRKGNVGKCSIFPKGFSKGIIHSDVLRIRTDNRKLLPVFLLFQLKHSKFIEMQIKGVTKGAIMAGINVGLLKNILVHQPPIELQTQFSQIVEKTEALKTQYQQSLQELENLYGSLSQKAFRGELYLKEEGLLMAAEQEVKYEKNR